MYEVTVSKVQYHTSIIRHQPHDDDLSRITTANNEQRRHTHSIIISALDMAYGILSSFITTQNTKKEQ